MRKPIVSRTIKTTKVTIAVKLPDGVGKTAIMIAGSWKNENDLLNRCRAVAADLNVIGILDYETRSILYGMSEQTFIENADILDAKTRKPILSNI